MIRSAVGWQHWFSAMSSIQSINKNKDICTCIPVTLLPKILCVSNTLYNSFFFSPLSVLTDFIFHSLSKVGEVITATAVPFIISLVVQSHGERDDKSPSIQAAVLKCAFVTCLSLSLCLMQSHSVTYNRENWTSDVSLLHSFAGPPSIQNEF